MFVKMLFYFLDMQLKGSIVKFYEVVGFYSLIFVFDILKMLSKFLLGEVLIDLGVLVNIIKISFDSGIKYMVKV